MAYTRNPVPTKSTPITLSLNYKRDKQGDIEERKAMGALWGKLMRPQFHFDLKCTSAPIVDRTAARMVISHAAIHGWILENMEIHKAFLNER